MVLQQAAVRGVRVAVEGGMDGAGARWRRVVLQQAALRGVRVAVEGGMDEQVRGGGGWSSSKPLYEVFVS